jgi:hypothetical protein
VSDAIASSIFAAIAVAVTTLLGILVGWTTGGASTTSTGAKPAYDENAEKLLQSAIDFVKVTTTAAAATLAFGVGYVASAPSMPFWPRTLALASGFILAISIFFGFVTQSGLLGKMEEHKYSLQDRTWTLPAVTHLFAFAVAMFLMASMLFQLLWEQPTTDSFKIPTADAAIRTAIANQKSWLPAGERINKITATEFIRGVDAAKGSLGTWHVQIQLEGSPQATPRKSVVKKSWPPIL